MVLEASDRGLIQFEQGLQNTAVKDLSRPGKSVAGLAEDYVQVPCVYVLCVCLMCVPYVYALCVCLMCMPYMYVLCVCLMCMPYMCAVHAYTPTCPYTLPNMPIYLHVLTQG
jgi:hypothetical protein